MKKLGETLCCFKQETTKAEPEFFTAIVLYELPNNQHHEQHGPECEEMKEDPLVACFDIEDFYLVGAEGFARTVRIKVTSADLSEGTDVKMSFYLERHSDFDNHQDYRYGFEIVITDNLQRNIALELLNVLGKLGESHLQYA
jgi:hypothetical protein